MAGNAAEDKQVGERVNDVDSIKLAAFPDGEAVPGAPSMMLSIRYFRPQHAEQ